MSFDNFIIQLSLHQYIDTGMIKKKAEGLSQGLLLFRA